MQKGARVEDYSLYFYDPVDEAIELVKGGREEPVTLANL